MDERDITLVAAAFDRLMATLERTCDTATCWTIASAKDDVIDILAGDSHADQDDQRDEDSSGYADAVAPGLERWARGLSPQYPPPPSGPSDTGHAAGR